MISKLIEFLFSTTYNENYRKFFFHKRNWKKRKKFPRPFFSFWTKQNYDPILRCCHSQ